MPEQESTETAPTQSEGTGSSAGTSPPWGDPDKFNAETAWKLIENLKADKEKLANRPALSKEDRDKIAAYDKHVADNQTELERAQQAAKAADERVASYRDRALGAEVRAAASAFVDPNDALAFLDKSALVNDAGDINPDAIKSALDELGRAKPHLLRPTGPVSMQPNPAQGRSGNGAPGPRSAAAEAEQAGDWKKAMDAKAQLLVDMRKNF